jgi:HSP20 family molecular chaperone IbpA
VEVPQKKPTLVDAHSLSARTKQVYEAVARRAYELFEGRSYQNGHDVEDWLRAESELLCPVSVEIEESKDQLMVFAKVRGFTAQDIEISAEAQCLFISGKREHSLEQRVNEAVFTW